MNQTLRGALLRNLEAATEQTVRLDMNTPGGSGTYYELVIGGRTAAQVHGAKALELVIRAATAGAEARRDFEAERATWTEQLDADPGDGCDGCGDRRTAWELAMGRCGGCDDDGGRP